MKMHLDFKGYWLASEREGIPAVAGVYCVYKCVRDAERRVVQPTRLLYVGESVSIRERLSKHELERDWNRRLLPGEELCFSVAPIILYRKRAEATLIFGRKPECNLEHRFSYPFESTELLLSGRIAFLGASYRVPDPALAVFDYPVPRSSSNSCAPSFESRDQSQ